MKAKFFTIFLCGTFCVILILSLACCTSTSSNNKAPMENTTNLFLPGTQPRLVSRQFAFTEGPAADREGNIFFTDQPNDKIWKYDVNGGLSLFSDHTARSNGLYIDASGNVVACADEKGQLISFNADAEMHVLMERGDGVRFNGPNDLWIDPRGGIYFTDPYYERNYWKQPKPAMQEQNVYYLPPGASEPVIVDDDIIKPNGIIGTADGKYLFVADIEGNKTFKYEINPDGTVTNKKLFVSMGSDGMTLDNKGNLYITGNGVTIFDPGGEKITQIPIDEGWTANVCFGGKYKKDLFITASKGIYIMPMLVSGAQ